MGTLMKNGISYSGGGSELPEYTSADAEKVLKVNSGGSGLEWGVGGTTGEYLEKINPTGKGTLNLAFNTEDYQWIDTPNIKLGDNKLQSSGVDIQKLSGQYGNVILGTPSTTPLNLVNGGTLYDTVIGVWQPKNVGYTHNSIMLDCGSYASNASVGAVGALYAGYLHFDQPTTGYTDYTCYGGVKSGYNIYFKSPTTGTKMSYGDLITGSESTVSIGTSYGCDFSGYHNNISLSEAYGVKVSGQGITLASGYTLQGWDVSGYYTSVAGLSGYGNHVEGDYVEVVGNGSLIGAHVQGYYHKDIGSSGSMYGADHGGYYTTAIIGNGNYGCAYGDLLRGYNVFSNGTYNYGTLVTGYNISLSYDELYGGAIEGVGFGAPGQPAISGGKHHGVHIEGVCNFFTRESTASASTAVHIEGTRNNYYSYDNYSRGIHIEGYNNTTNGAHEGLHVEGHTNNIQNNVSTPSFPHTGVHIEGNNNTLILDTYYEGGPHIEGSYNNIAGDAHWSHIENYNNTTTGSVRMSHVGGYHSTAQNTNSSFVHGEKCFVGSTASDIKDYIWVGGYQTTADGYTSIAFGGSNYAHGSNSAAIGGYGNQVFGDYSAVLNYHNIAIGSNQTIVGKYNIPLNDALFIVGNGDYVGDSDVRSNAFYVTTAGNATLAGDLTVNYNGTSYNVGQTLANISIPTITTADAGKVLMVDANGHLVLATVPAWS